jgi:general secretion pathway protein E
MLTEKEQKNYNFIDAQLYNYLYGKKFMAIDPLKAGLMETTISSESLGVILVRNGFLTQDQVVESMIELKPEYLVDEETIVPNIPPEDLKDNALMICAITDSTVYAATMKSTNKAKMVLNRHFPAHQIIFIPCNPEKLDGYLEKLDAIYNDDGSVVERIIRKAIQENISDIHIIPHYDSYTIMFRYLGVRHVDTMGAKDEYLSLVARIKDLSRMDLAEKRKPQDGGFQIDYNGRLVDLRVATIPTPDGENVVIRILDPENAQVKIGDLGVSNVKDWQKGMSRPDGLCLICGPTGSGKTTTLNATLKELDRFGKAIYTAEDPVEYRIPYIAQVNINASVGLDFPRAVKAFMRADPDVIIVGEVRDEETARNAIKAAETGHLVFATLHTGSIPGAVNRLRDLGVDSHELKYVLRSVLAQRLIRTLCKTCKGHGCRMCFEKGYAGRSVVSEVKYFTDMTDVLKIITTDEKDVEIDWSLMIEDAFNKYKNNEVSPGEFVRVFGHEAEKMLLEDGLDLRSIGPKGIVE